MPYRLNAMLAYCAPLIARGERVVLMSPNRQRADDLKREVRHLLSQEGVRFLRETHIDLTVEGGGVYVFRTMLENEHVRRGYGTVFESIEPEPFGGNNLWELDARSQARLLPTSPTPPRPPAPSRFDREEVL